VAKVREDLNFGNQEDMTLEKLILIVQEAYRDLAVAVNGKPDLIQRDVNGAVTDNFLSNGTININNATDNVEIITNHSADGSTVTWTTI